MQPLHRRSFLGAGAALALAGLPRLAAEDKADPFGGFRLGAQSYTFRDFNLEQALKRMKKLGLHYGEFYQKHCPLTDKPDADQGVPEAVQGVRRHAVGLGRAGLHQGPRRQQEASSSSARRSA